MTPTEIHAAISWQLLEYKIMYYREDQVHHSHHAALVITDASYDALEVKYLMLCRELDLPNTLVHKGYPGLEDLVDDGSMFEVDEDRPSVQLAMDKLRKPRVGDLI